MVSMTFDPDCLSDSESEIVISEKLVYTVS